MSIRIVYFSSWIVTILSLFVVIASFSHRYPMRNELDYIQDAYFGLYTYGHNESELTRTFHRQLLRRNSAYQDYLIASWMNEHSLCLEEELLTSNFEYYRQIDLDSAYSDSTRYYYIRYYIMLGDEIDSMKLNCE